MRNFWLVVCFILRCVTMVHAEFINIPDDYPTIQQGLDAAEAGDTLIVEPGTYPEHIIWPMVADISLLGTGEPGDTIIDGTNNGRVLFIPQEASDVILENLTITNGQVGLSPGGTGGGAGLQTQAGVYMYNTIFSRNTVRGDLMGYESEPRGAAILGGIITADICRFNENQIIADNYTTFDSGGSVIYGSDLVAVNCVFSGNEAYISDGWGGVIQDSIISISNCLFNDNSAFYCSGVAFCSGSIKYCTFAHNQAQTDLEHAPMTQSSIITGGVAFTELQDCCEITNPVFVHGDLGNYYLSQVEAGQSIDSPCLDLGAEQADEACYDSSGEEICMNERTTRSDNVPDTGSVDAGFHYFTDMEPVTPTPTSSCTPTPALTEVPTTTPTVSVGVQLTLSKEHFTASDHFKLIAKCRVDEAETYADFYVVLDVSGDYWFYPDWTQGVNFEQIELFPKQVQTFTILDFTWPDGDFGFASDLTFYGAIMNPGTAQVIGAIGSVFFGYS